MKRIILCLFIISIIDCCSTQRKLSLIQTQNKVVTIVPNHDIEKSDDIINYLSPDSIKHQDFKEKNVTIMNAVKDENGEMVATDVIKAAIITAKFRNVAERKGKINLGFQITVPRQMQDSKWQLRFYPQLFINNKITVLDPIIITGTDYRKVQLRGYQQYEKFLESIIKDSSKLINKYQLEIFIKRNIPALFKFKGDTSFVSDDVFQSNFGITEKDASKHYTNHLLLRINERRKAKKEEIFKKYIKVPIQKSGFKIDTVINNINNEFIYNYNYVMTTSPNLKKAIIKISGKIYEKDIELYSIQANDSITFYISSLSNLIDKTVKYKYSISDTGKTMSNIIDTTYMEGVNAISNRDFQKAINILSPYKDYNTALAYSALDYNESALKIVEGLPISGETEYLKAILYARSNNEKISIKHYINACNINSSYKHRGNLDPEISILINKYKLNREN